MQATIVRPRSEALSREVLNATLTEDARTKIGILGLESRLETHYLGSFLPSFQEICRQK